jgi:methylmalonyl-CoA mutase C-terminal domain/subunit
MTTAKAATPTRRRPIRVLLAKPGLDGHDRGAKVVARALRDAGMEVTYTGLHQTPEGIVRSAIQEDADAIGLSILSGAHLALIDQIMDQLRDNHAEDYFVIVVGGIIPSHHIPVLENAGVDRVFPPGSPLTAIVDFLNQAILGDDAPALTTSI